MNFLQRSRAGLRTHLLPLGAILALCALSFLTVFDPVVYMDDWDLFRKFIFRDMLVVNPHSRRPLEDAVIWVLLSLFGVHPVALMLAGVGIIFLCAACLYFLIRRAFPRLDSLALPAALLFVIYPVDYTRLWMTRGYQWVIYLCLFIGFLLLDEFIRGGRGWKLALALIVMTPALWAYDGQLGLLVSGCLMIALFSPAVSLRRRLWSLSPCLGGAGLVLWRLYLQPTLLGVHDVYLSQSTFSPLVLGQRILAGFPVFFEGWVKPFEAYLPGLSPVKLLLILGASCLVALLAAHGAARETRPTGAPLAWRERWLDARGLWAPCAAGLLFWAAGYLPAIVLGEPNLNLNGSTTRTNTFAIAGGALWLSTLIALPVTLLSAERPRRAGRLLTALIPLILVGAAQQIWIQNEARLAWRSQQTFWRMAFITLPNLKDNATVLVAVHGPYPSKPFERLPLTAEWEVNHGLRVLYNNPTLQGMLLFLDFKAGVRLETYLAPDGAHGYIIDRVPYDRLVIVTYSPSNQVMKIVEDPEVELDLPFQVHGYNPHRFILPDPPAQTLYRYLVH